MRTARLRTTLATLLQEDGPSEDQDRLTDRAVDALRASGALRAGVPGHLGGSEASFPSVSDDIVRLGTAAGAAAWVAALAYGSNLAGALLPQPGQRELWEADPDAHVCGSFSPSGTARPVPDGYVVDAVVETVSGIHSAGWLMAMVLVQGAGRPVLVFVPTAEVQVERTWSVTGLRGSGSDRGSVTGVAVPAHRVIAVEDFVTGMARRGLPVEAFGPALLAAPLVGLARGAVDLALESLREGADGPAGRAHRDDVRAAYADAAIAADRAEGLSRVARGLLGTGDGDEAADAVRRSVNCTAAAVQEAVRASGLVTVAVGSRALRRDSRADRIWRDLETGSRHPLFTPRALPARYLVDLDDRERH